MKAYVVCLTNDRYLPGLYAIDHGLKSVGSQYPLVVLVPDSECELAARLVSRGYVVRQSPGINLKGAAQDFYWDHTFFKLAAASLFEYEKIVLLDGDMMILENIDFLFDLPHLSATINGRVTYPWKKGFSSGVLVIDPSESYFKQLCTIAPKLKKEFNDQGRFAGDQDVFNASCPDWFDRKELHFHERFNESLVSAKDFRRVYPKTNIAVVHFGGPVKPWDWSLMHFVGVWLLKFLLRFDFTGAFYLRTYYSLTRYKARKSRLD